MSPKTGWAALRDVMLMTLQRRMENVWEQQWKRFTINFTLQIKECSPWQEHIRWLARTITYERIANASHIFFNNRILRNLCELMWMWRDKALEHDILSATGYTITALHMCCVMYLCDVIMCQCGMCLSYGRLFRTLAGNFQVQKWNANLCPKALSQCEHCTPNNDGLDLTEVWDKARSNTNTNTNTRTNKMCGNQGISKLKSQLSVNRKKKNLTFIPFHSIAVLRSSLFIN